MLSELFWTSFVTTLIALIGFSLRICLRSKCDQVEICCLKVHRAVDLEATLPDISNLYSHNLNNEENLNVD